MKYFSLDIESTGLDRDSCQILELGVIFEDTDNPKSYSDSAKFHAIVKKDFYTGQPYAIQLNNRIFRIISEIDPLPSGCEIFEAETDMIQSLANWAKICLNGSDNFRMTLAGKNVAAFDLQWLKPFVPKGQKFGTLFRHRTIDPANMYAKPGDEDMPGLLECLERAGLDPSDYHTSLGDSWDIIKLVRKYWNYGLELI